MRFPALTLAREAGTAGATYPTVLSAADEIAVNAFVAERLSFTGITDVVSQVLDEHRPQAPLSFESIAAADLWARDRAATVIRSIASSSR
jgi:1-deoxy-D-xylulose-5-phosphate reductoisomerase